MSILLSGPWTSHSHGHIFLPYLPVHEAEHEHHSLRAALQPGSQSLRPCCSRERSQTPLPPLFSLKAQAPSQGRSLMLWQPSLLLGSWPLSPALFLQRRSQINVLQGAEHLMLTMTFSGKPTCFHNLTFNCWGLPVPQLRPAVLKV